MNAPLMPIATTDFPLAASWRLEDDVLVEEGDGWRRLYGRWDKTFGCWTVPLPAENPGARVPFEPDWPVLGRHGTLPDGPRDEAWYASRAAIAAYFSLIPLPIRRLVSSFGPRQWPLLEAIWRDPQVARTMPDVHWGMGATVGSVIATKGAIIPAAVGVDIGCGMMAVRTTVRAEHLPDDLHPIRCAIEAAVPHGRTDNGGPRDRGAWGDPPEAAVAAWAELEPGFARIRAAQSKVASGKTLEHLGTLGTGNHFIELCLDEAGAVWVMLHSGSRGIGNRIGSVFIELAKRDMERFFIRLPDADLAYFPEGTEHFAQYMHAVAWAQKFARTNRQLMMDAVPLALGRFFPDIGVDETAVNCHHNYVNTEKHFGQTVLLTRKGAVRAQQGDLGIIPGSMGAKSFIVRGKGNPESFCSCSHGAGRAMSRNAAKKAFTLEDHAKATEGVECRKDAEVLDETPGAYKDIDAVMAAQSDLVEIVHTLKQMVCVKG